MYLNKHIESPHSIDYLRDAESKNTTATMCFQQTWKISNILFNLYYMRGNDSHKSVIFQKETDDGISHTPDWLYYTPQKKFRTTCFFVF